MNALWLYQQSTYRQWLAAMMMPLLLILTMAVATAPLVGCSKNITQDVIAYLDEGAIAMDRLAVIDPTHAAIYNGVKTELETASADAKAGKPVGQIVLDCVNALVPLLGIANPTIGGLIALALAVLQWVLDHTQATPQTAKAKAQIMAATAKHNVTLPPAPKNAKAFKAEWNKKVKQGGLEYAPGLLP